MTGQVSNAGSATATFSGTVNPSGAKTTYCFQYGTSSSTLGSKAGVGDAGSANGSVPVSASVSGLKSGRT